MYYTYANYLKDQYGQKVYKLPVNLPVTCPNRDGARGTGGCIFCSDVGADFEMLDVALTVAHQLEQNKAHISKAYKANAFIAYFQNFTNTYLPVDQLMAYIEEVKDPDIVEIALSTRPDCISRAHLQAFKDFENRTGKRISIELGLQTINSRTLEIINRGHDFADFVHAVLLIKQYGFTLGVHLIPNLPWDRDEDVIEAAKMMSALGVDTVKLHSLYVLKGTELGRQYLEGSLNLGSPEAYYERVISFLEHLDPKIAVQRFFGRAPEDQTLFCNWGRSWRYLQNTLEAMIEDRGVVQGARLKWGVYE